MSWAEKRETKREEDGAYCLLGVFNIHMPLIYGEGKKNAITRLRDEIDKRSKNGVSASLSPGTGQWFFNSPKFKESLCTAKGTLICLEPLGVGRNMLTSNRNGQPAQTFTFRYRSAF